MQKKLDDESVAVGLITAVEATSGAVTLSTTTSMKSDLQKKFPAGMISAGE